MKSNYFREARTAVYKQTFPNMDCADHNLFCKHCLLDMFPPWVVLSVSFFVERTFLWQKEGHLIPNFLNHLVKENIFCLVLFVALTVSVHQWTHFFLGAIIFCVSSSTLTLAPNVWCISVFQQMSSACPRDSCSRIFWFGNIFCMVPFASTHGFKSWTQFLSSNHVSQQSYISWCQSLTRMFLVPISHCFIFVCVSCEYLTMYFVNKYSQKGNFGM